MSACPISQIQTDIIETFEYITQKENGGVGKAMREMIVQGAAEGYPLNQFQLVLNGVIEKGKQEKLSPFQIQELMDIASNIVQLYPRTPSKVIPNLSMNFDETQTELIQISTRRGQKAIISKNLSSYITKQLYQTLTGVGIVDLTAETPKFVRTNGDLKESIESWRSRLVDNLIKYLRTKGYITKREINSQGFIPKMREVMTKAWEYIQDDLNDKKTYADGKLDAATDSAGLRTVITPILSLAVLNDFDNVIEFFSKGEINVNPVFKNTIEIYADKYTTNKQSVQITTWDGDFSDASVEHIVPNILKRVVETIPTGHGDGSFCSIYDINSIIKHVYTLACTEHGLNPALPANSMLEDDDAEPYRVLFSDDTTESQKRDALYEILTSTHFMNRFADSDKIKSIVKHFKKLDDAFDKSSPTQYLEDKAWFSTQRNLTNQLIALIRHSCTLAYARVASNGFDINSNSGVRKNKTMFQARLKLALKENLYGDKHRLNLYNPNYILANSSKPVWDWDDFTNEEFIDYIKQTTGQDISVTHIQDWINDEENFDTAKHVIGSFIFKFNSLVTSSYLNKGKSLDNENSWNEFVNHIISELVSTEEYVAFTDMLANESGQDQSMLYSLSQDPIPSQGAQAPISKWAQNCMEFVEQYDVIKDLLPSEDAKIQNIFLRYPGLRSNLAGSQFGQAIFTDPIVFRSDVLFQHGKYEEVVKSVKLSAEELATVSILYEFLDSTMKTGLVVAQIENVSDKARVPLGVLNGKSIIRNDRIPTGKEFNSLTIDELKDIYFDQSSWYYKAVEASIIDTYRTLFPACGWDISSAVTLDDYIKILEQHTLDELYKGVRKIFNEGGYIELHEYLHYEPKAGPDKKLRFNNTLYHSITAAYDREFFDALVDKGIEVTKNDLKAWDLPIPQHFKQGDIADDLIKTLQLKGITKAEVNTYLRDPKKGGKLWNPAYEGIFDALIDRYVVISNMIADADLQLSSKFGFLHKTKQAPLTIAELHSMSLDERVRNHNLSLSDRGKVARKRYATMTSLSEPVSPKDTWGPGATRRIAYIRPHEQRLFNPAGDAPHDQPTNDGAVFGNGIWDIIEAWGYEAKQYNTNSQKIIGIIPSFANMHFIKTAKYSINNERIRASFDNPVDKHHYNFHTLFYKINNVPLPSNFLSDWAKSSSKISETQIWKVIDGQLAFFNEETLEVDGNIVRADWITEDGTILKSEVPINTVYDLWSYFGGCDSYSYNEFNTLQPSEISQFTTALLLCQYGGNTKDKLISLLVDTESAKEGQLNINSVEETADPNTPLLYQIVKTSRFGLQNDYTHESIDTDIPMLTQAVQALALNGFNPELAQSVFEELASIIDDSLVSVEDYFDPTTRDSFKKKLIFLLSESLMNNNVSSTANDIVKHTMEQFQQWVNDGKEGPMPQLPFSDRNIFSKVTSDMLVRLNHNGIRQRFNGIAVIQNPSQGVFGVYEDANGRVLTRENLRRKHPNFDHHAYLREAAEFQPEPLTSQSMLTIGDVYASEFDEQGNPKSIIITSPAQLWEIEGAIRKAEALQAKEANGEIITDAERASIVTYYKIRSAKRDLKTRQVTFRLQARDTKGNLLFDDQDQPILGESMNLWNLRSTKYRLMSTCGTMNSDFSDIVEDGDEFGLIKAVMSSDPAAMMEYSQHKLSKTATLAYFRANNQGLGDPENPYVYLTYEDYLKGEEGRTYVYDVKTEAGEQAIPNKYKHIFGIEDSLADVLYQVDESTGRHNYFDHILHKKLVKTHTIKVTGKHFGATLTTNKAEILITNQDVAGSILTQAKEYDGSYYLTDVNGNRLFEVPEGTYNLSIIQLQNGKYLYQVQVQDMKQADIIIRKMRDVNLYYNEKGMDHLDRLNRQQGVSFNPNRQETLNEYIKQQSDAVYNSFVLTLNTISTRIPSQSWPSFQATKTVAFTDNDLNDGYMNIWEMWFQGSDFDIDKAYTMMYAVDRFGRIEGNGFVDYSTPETIIKTLHNSMSKQNKRIEFLPAWSAEDVDHVHKSIQKHGVATKWDPDDPIGYFMIPSDTSEESMKKFLSGFVGNVFTDDNGNVHVSMTPDTIDYLVDCFPYHKDVIYSQLLAAVENLKGVVAVNTLKLKGQGEFVYYRWMHDLNKFNRKNLTPFRQNRIMSQMWEATLSLLNYEAAIKPMDSGLVNNRMDEVKKDNVEYNEFSPLTKLKMQFNAQMGKDDVGGAANGIKADGGLQHHITYRSMLETARQLYTPNVKLSFDYGGRKIGDFDIFKVANVNINFDDFKIMLDRAYAGEDIFNNPLIRSLQATAKVSPEYFDANGKKLEYYERVSDAFKLWGKVEHPKLMTTDDVQEFLYYFSQFEDNAADILSVLISLATDNAKELRLASLNAPIELISIPLALTIYGIDVRSMVDICMHVLTPVLKQITQNRFDPKYKKLEVKDAIRACVKAKQLSEKTGESLLQVVRLATELRYLTSFYKINQGANTNVIELQRWTSQLLQMKPEFEKEYANEVFNIVKEISRQFETYAGKDVGTLSDQFKQVIAKCVLKDPNTLTQPDYLRFLKAVEVGLNKGESRPINFIRLFGDDTTYKNALVDYFNMFSTGFNVLDVVIKSPSYNSQLGAVSVNLEVMNNMMCVNAISQALINLNPNKSISDNNVKMLFGNLSIGEFTKRLDDFKFNKTSIESTFKGISVPGALDSYFDLSTNTGVTLFMQIVRNGVIPKLMKQYARTNFFVSSLKDKQNYHNGMPYMTLPFNQFANKDQEIERAYIAEAKVQFGKIMRLSSGLVNSQGKELSIGEVLYVYNLIATGGSMNALTTCVEQISEFSELPAIYKAVVESLDRQAESLEGNIATTTKQVSPILNGELIQKLDKINKALESSDKMYSDTGGTFSLRGQWILTNVLISPLMKAEDIQTQIQEEFPAVKAVVFTTVEGQSTQEQYQIQLEYNINGKTVKDSISGIISVSQKGKYAPHNLEQIRYSIYGKIKYVENILGIDHLVQSIESSKNIQDVLHVSSDGISIAAKKVLDLIGQNTEIEVIKVKKAITPYSAIFNGQRYLILPDSTSYDVNSPEMLNALIGLTTDGKIASNLLQVLSLITNKQVGPRDLTAQLRLLYKKDNKIVNFHKEFRDYIDWVQEETTLESVKEQFSLTLAEFERVFHDENARPFYFEESPEDTSLQVGDIFEVFGEKRIYLGINEGRYVTCSLDGNTRPLFSFADPSQYKKVFAKKKSIQERIGIVSKAQFNYTAEVDKQPKPFTSLNIGDLIIADGIEWFISDVLLDKNDQVQLVASNEEGPILFTQDQLEGLSYQTKTASINRSQIGFLASRFKATDSLTFKVPDNHVFNNTQEIITPEYRGYFQKKVSDTKIAIATSDGNRIIDTSAITEITTPLGSVFDVSLKYLVTPVTFVATTQQAARFKGLYQIPGAWIENDTYDKVKYIKTGNVKSSAHLFTQSDSNLKNIHYYYNESTTQNYQVGDILELSGNRFFKIVETKNGYMLGIMQDGHEQSYSVIDASEAIITHYTPKTQGQTYVRPQVTANLSDFQIGKRVLEIFRERFKTDVIIDSDPTSSHFAQVIDGKIVINTARLDDYNSKLPEKDKITLEKYIALQGIHEFAHLMLTQLQVSHSNLYFEMMSIMESYIKTSGDRSIWEAIKANKTYTSDFERYEEFIVRLIEKKFRENLDTIFALSDDNVLESEINRLLRSGFGVFANMTRVNPHSTIKSLITDLQKDIFGYTTQDTSVEFLRQNSVDAKLLSNIYCIS